MHEMLARILLIFSLSFSLSLFLSLFWSDRAFVVYVGWRAVWYCGAAQITVYWVVKYTYMHARACIHNTVMSYVGTWSNV